MNCRDTLEALVKGFQSDGAPSWEAVIQFIFHGEGGGEYYLEIRQGECKLYEGRAENPTSEVETDSQIWLDVALGKMNPVTAFMTGRVKARGHMGDLLKLQDRRIFKVTGLNG